MLTSNPDYRRVRRIIQNENVLSCGDVGACPHCVRLLYVICGEERDSTTALISGSKRETWEKERSSFWGSICISSAALKR